MTQLKKPPQYIQLSRANGDAGAWHWTKLFEEIRSRFWIITGCGNGFYDNDSHVVATGARTTAISEGGLCGRCKRARLAARLRKVREDKKKKSRRRRR